MKKQIKQAISAAYKQLPDFVANVTLRHKTDESYNPSTGQMEATYAEVSVNVIITEYSLTEIANSSGLILAGNKKVLLPFDFVNYRPVSGDDKLIIDGETHTIESVRSVYDCLYVLRI